MLIIFSCKMRVSETPRNVNLFITALQCSCWDWHAFLGILCCLGKFIHLHYRKYEQEKKKNKYSEAKITEEDYKQCKKSILHSKKTALTDMHSWLYTPTMHTASLLNSFPFIHHVTCRLFIQRQKARFLSLDTAMVIDTSRHWISEGSKQWANVLQ